MHLSTFIAALAVVEGVTAQKWSRPLAKQASSPTAKTQQGVVKGKVVRVGLAKVNSFQGIPFASPPVRFAAPEDAKPFNKTLDATRAKPACIQQFNGKSLVTIH